MSVSAWIISGVVAALGGIDWPVATFLSIALTIPTLGYDTVVEDVEDD